MNHQQSIEIITGFMGQLNYRYDSADMHKLWKAMSLQQDKFGDIYVAEAIQKDRTDAELALFRFYKKYLNEPVTEEPEYELSPTVRFHKAYPKQRSIVKRLLAMLAVAMVIGLAVFTIAKSSRAINNTTRFLSEVDKFIEQQERRDTDGIH